MYYFGVCRVSNTEREFETEYQTVTGTSRKFASIEEAYNSLPQTPLRRQKFARHKARRSLSTQVHRNREMLYLEKEGLNKVAGESQSGVNLGGFKRKRLRSKSRKRSRSRR